MNYRLLKNDKTLWMECSFWYICVINVVTFTFIKDIYSCPIEIIKGLTDKEQFLYLTKLKGPQEGTYLYTTQFLSLR